MMRASGRSSLAGLSCFTSAASTPTHPDAVSSGTASADGAPGLVLFIVTVTVNAAARLLVWRVARGSAAGSRAL